VKKVSKVLLVMLLSFMFCIGERINALTVNSLNLSDNLSDSTFDIKGVINTSTPVSTTYDDEGYEVTLKVGNGTKNTLKNYTIDNETTIDGIKVKLSKVSENEEKH